MSRRWIGAVSAVLAAALTTTGATAQTTEVGAFLHSRPTEVLLVNVNLHEGFQVADVADTRDVANFVDRIAHVVPVSLVPDVVTLQEVRLESARNVADALERHYDDPFAVVAEPPETPWQPDGSRNDTAVVANLATMEMEAEPVTIRTEGNNVKDNVATLLREIDGGLALPVTSMHWAHGGYAPANATASVDGLDEEYGSPARHRAAVIAGDLNMRRCSGPGTWKTEAVDCVEQSWYKRMTSAGYIDAVLAARPGEIREAQESDQARIDYIFTSGRVRDAGSDIGYKPALRSAGCDPREVKAAFAEGRSDEVAEPCRELFYTDHRMVWAILGPAHSSAPG